jgi:hypothetical protein
VRRPDPRGRDPWSRGLRYIFEQRGDPGGHAGVTVVVDEMVWVAPLEPCDEIARLVCQGMGNGIGAWGATQRPARVYRNWFTEALWTISFRLQGARDRATLEADLGIPCASLQRLGQHRFQVYHQGDTDWSPPLP